MWGSWQMEYLVGEVFGGYASRRMGQLEGGVVNGWLFGAWVAGG